MIVAIVTFRQRKKRSLAEMKAIFEGTAPKYLNLPGLLRKNYFVSEDGLRAGGIYVWDSKARARRFYSPEWKSFVAGKYGAQPEIQYLDAPVMVDNAAGKITVD
ncbi:MAG: monooxygenase [Betaproteobacteria bacterium]|nr:monooxygenase [Betaproteobacteria bacterium]